MPSRRRIYPIRKDLFLEELTEPKKNKYEGLRKECDEFKAHLRAIGNERRAAEAKAVAAGTKPHMRKRKSRPDLFTSTFNGLLKEWFSFHWHNLKDWGKNMKYTVKYQLLPTLFCLRAEAVIPYNE